MDTHHAVSGPPGVKNKPSNALDDRHDSLGEKLGREVSMLAEGTADGIADAARDAWTHKGMSTLKVGASALIGAGVSIAAAELGLPALAITAVGAAAGVVSAKELLKDGKKAFSAMKDCWRDADRCDEGKDVVKKIAGPLVIDTVLAAAGGIVGASVTRTVPLYMKEKKLLGDLEIYHPETAEHSMRVAQYSKLTTKELGLPYGVQREAYHAGKMHDVGKLQVSKNVLNKPSELDPKEFAAIKEHPGNSQEILEKLPYRGPLKNVAQDAGSHHEHVDGTGYPNKLQSDQLSPVAKTLAPADVFDAMTSGRAYAREGRAAFERTALPDVKKSLDSKVGTHFDEKSLNAMWNVPANKMVGVLESAERRPHIDGDVLRQFKGVRFGRLLDVLGGAQGTAEEHRLAGLLNQLYQAR